jgi:hypothetical protein
MSPAVSPPRPRDGPARPPYFRRRTVRGTLLLSRAYARIKDIEEPVRRSHLAMKQSRPLRRSHKAAASALERPVTRRA